MLSLCACMVNDSLTPLEAAEDTTSMVCNPEVNGCRTQTNWSIIAISAHIECTTHPLMTQAPCVCVWVGGGGGGWSGGGILIKVTCHNSVSFFSLSLSLSLCVCVRY